MTAVQCVILDAFYNWLIFNIVINFVFFLYFCSKIIIFVLFFMKKRSLHYFY